MASMQQTIARTAASDRADRVVPAHVIENKRQERVERVRRVMGTIIGQAISAGAEA